MAEGGDPRIKAQAVSQNIFDVVRADRIKVTIMRTLGDNHNCLAFTYFPVLGQIN
jgi:hypothetical protein